jgi:hypothetical protein
MAGALHPQQEHRIIAAESATYAAMSEVDDEIGHPEHRGIG